MSFGKPLGTKKMTAKYGNIYYSTATFTAQRHSEKVSIFLQIKIYEKGTKLSYLRDSNSYKVKGTPITISNVTYEGGLG